MMNAKDCLWNQQFRRINPEDHLLDEQVQCAEKLTVKLWAINFSVVVIITFFYLNKSLVFFTFTIPSY